MPRDGLHDELRWDELRELAKELTADLPSRDNTICQPKKDDTPRSLAGTRESPFPTKTEDDQGHRPLQQPRVAPKQPTYRFESARLPQTSSPSGMTSTDRIPGQTSAPRSTSSNVAASDHLPASPVVASDREVNSVFQQRTSVSPDGKLTVVRQTKYQNTPRQAMTPERKASADGVLATVGEPVVSSLNRKPAVMPLSVDVGSGHMPSGPRSASSTSSTSFTTSTSTSSFAPARSIADVRREASSSVTVERVTLSPTMQKVTISPRIELASNARTDMVPASSVSGRERRIEPRFFNAQSSNVASASGANSSPYQRHVGAFGDRSPSRVLSPSVSKFSDAIPSSPKNPITMRNLSPSAGSTTRHVYPERSAYGSPSSALTKSLAVPAKEAQSELAAEQSLGMLLARLKGESMSMEREAKGLDANNYPEPAGFTAVQGFTADDHGFTVDEDGVMGWQV
mmetsp:Transcript_13253/g.31505  ORF Transcript_13253/g.31505 Transcript_13253/m.31505 type:complete len:456 (+) Transcript_13253:121-1488(+)